MADSIKIEAEGLDALLARMADAPDQIRQALGGALLDEAQEILAASLPLVPLKTGVLEASGFAALTQPDGDVIEAEVAFGGAAAAYAGPQHKHEEWHHPIRGQAHYLSEPFEQHIEGLGERVADKIREELGR